jgi:hypothetical protein
MRTFVGDEPFEPVATPPLPAREKPETADQAAPPALAPALGSIGWKLFKAARSEESKGDSGNLMPVFRQSWAILPEPARKVLRVVFRLALVGLAALMVLFAVTAGRGDPASTAILGALAAALLFIAAAFGRMRGWWDQIKATVTGGATRGATRVLGASPAEIGRRVSGWATPLYVYALLALGVGVWFAVKGPRIGVLWSALAAVVFVGVARLIVTPNPLRSAVLVLRDRLDAWREAQEEVISAWSRFALVLALGLVFVLAGGYALLAQGQWYGAIFVLSGAIAVIVALVYRPGRETAKPPAWLGLVIGVGVVALLGMVSATSLVSGHAGAAVVTGLFGTLFALVLIGGGIQARRTRHAAAIMHESALALAPAAVLATSPAASPPPAEAPATAASAPPIRIDVYLQRELASLPRPYQAPVSANANIVGLPPVRILYLYNFFSDDSLERKLDGDLRRFGPVYYLGSPRDFGVARGDLAAKVKASLLATPKAFDARLAEVSEAPLPPGDKDLHSSSHLSGGYPDHLFLCNDESWRHAVSTLFERADVVMVDASGYDAARGGLNWEFGQLVDRVPTDRFIVLLDAAADQQALCAAFRSAWAGMRAGSPNDRPDAGPVRWVIHEPLDARGLSTVAPVRPPPEVDPAGVYRKANVAMRFLFDVKYGRALEDDRIFGLFLEPPAVPS